MIVEFATRRLHAASQSKNEAARVLGSLGERYLARLDVLLAVESLEQLQAIHSLRLHPLKGDREGQWSIHLNGNYRLIVSFVDKTVIVEGVEDYHGD